MIWTNFDLAAELKLRDVEQIGKCKSVYSINLRPNFAGHEGLEAAQLLRHDSGDLQQAQACLSAGERARVARLKIPDLRENLTRTLIARRLWLARHFNVAPETITIDYDGAGAPRIQGWAPGELSFSRSEDWCAIACARARKVGIDIEVERDRDWPSILNFLSTPEEAEHIRHAVRSAGSLTPFYRTWCTKEAVLKVMGTGFKAGPKIINLPSAMLDGASEFDIALANGTARVGVETFETVTVALATARL